MKTVFSIIFFILVILTVSRAQKVSSEPKVQKQEQGVSRKKINTTPAAYQKAFETAFAAFPELDPSKIIFKTTKIKTTLNTRPVFGDVIFRKRDNRKYVIRINAQNKDSIITLDEVPFGAQVGILAHELCHITDYQNRSFFGIFSRLMSYLSKKKKEKFEKEIDLEVINRGLGKELYEWSVFVQDHSDATSHYKKFKRDVYLEPDEIIPILNER